MNLEEFKSIYFYEYFHRLLGRTIGVIFGVPFSFFLFKGYLLPKLKRRCGVLFLMGGF